MMYLPTELLYYIFMRSEWISWQTEDWHTAPSSVLYKPGVFPYSIANVCKEWRVIAQSVPSFWTRILLFVDNSHTPIPRLTTQLALSKDLSLDVFVLRHTHVQNEDRDEYHRCRAVIDLILPHLHRCRTIWFDVSNTSSLPSISLDFRGRSLSLKTLVLRAHRDDGIASGNRESAEPLLKTDERFLCPNLKNLDVDGRNFAYACLDSTSWHETLNAFPPGQLALAISTFSPNTGLLKDHNFTSSDFVEVLSNMEELRSLSLADLHYGESEITTDRDLSFNNMPCFTAKGLRSRFLLELRRVVVADWELDELHLIGCELGGVRAPPSGKLILQDMRVEEDLSDFLERWEGNTLEVVNCPGFDDGTLSTLGKCRNTLGCLIIIDCERFSTGGLFKLVDDWKDELDRISITVSGIGPPSPSLHEREFLAKFCREFIWTAKERIE